MKIVAAKGYRPPNMKGFEGTDRLYPIVGIPFSATLEQLSNLEYWTKGPLKEWGSSNDARELVNEETKPDIAYSIGFSSGLQRGESIVEQLGGKMYYVFQYVVKPWDMENFKKEALGMGAVFLKVSQEEITTRSV